MKVCAQTVLFTRLGRRWRVGRRFALLSPLIDHSDPCPFEKKKRVAARAYVVLVPFLEVECRRVGARAEQRVDMKLAVNPEQAAKLTRPAFAPIRRPKHRSQWTPVRDVQMGDDVTVH